MSPAVIQTNNIFCLFVLHRFPTVNSPAPPTEKNNRKRLSVALQRKAAAYKSVGSRVINDKLENIC